jgi:hypothetical protein
VFARFFELAVLQSREPLLEKRGNLRWSGKGQEKAKEMQRTATLLNVQTRRESNTHAWPLHTYQDICPRVHPQQAE